ncbi:MAG: hypothetical protein GY820_14470, partial [Gammaproteobacteria bacterium]|nr:hypothetical protein [Gammaproteobacteria bacterium]
MCDSALEMLHNLLDLDEIESPMSYEQLVAELSALFQRDLSVSVYRQQFYACRWKMNNKNENIDDFVSQLRGLSARAWPHSRRADREKTIAEQLLNSLPKNLHDSVMLSGNWSLN